MCLFQKCSSSSRTEKQTSPMAQSQKSHTAIGPDRSENWISPTHNCVQFDDWIRRFLRKHSGKCKLFPLIVDLNLNVCRLVVKLCNAQDAAHQFRPIRVCAQTAAKTYFNVTNVEPLITMKKILSCVTPAVFANMQSLISLYKPNLVAQWNL